jgi:hypothetical protein
MSVKSLLKRAAKCTAASDYRQLMTCDDYRRGYFDLLKANYHIADNTDRQEYNA